MQLGAIAKAPGEINSPGAFCLFGSLSKRSEAGKSTVNDEIAAGGERTAVTGKVNGNALQFLRLTKPVQGSHGVPLRDHGLQTLQTIGLPSTWKNVFLKEFAKFYKTSQLCSLLL